MTVEPLIRIFDEIRAGSPAERQYYAKDFQYEDIEQILAEADELLQQINPEIIEYMDEGQRAQLEQQAQRLKKLKSEVQDKIGKEGHRRAILMAKECTRRLRILWRL